MERTVRILLRRDVFDRFVFRIEEVTFQHERFDGSMSNEIIRLILQRGDSVAMLLGDQESRSVLLCEQFRAPTYDRGPGWLWELPAGMIERNESDEDCARREALEETGYLVKSFQRIANVYLSPGGSSERVSILYGEISMNEMAGPGGGNIAEGEDIRMTWFSAAEAIAMAHHGDIHDAKTLIALQWLELAPIRLKVG